MTKTSTRLTWFCLLLISLLTSCRSSAPAYNYRELAKAGIALGLDIAEKDNHKLYIETSRWIGVPYRKGGNSPKGIDCSGFTKAIYNKVYHITLERGSNDQLKKDCRKINKRHLQEGDLVFFHGRRSRKTASHVGIYLKDNKFVHASTSRGVMVSNLNEAYWQQHWLTGGRVR